MPRIPISVQLYSVREDAQRDLPGVLKGLSKMGFQGVEFAGYYGHSAADIRKMLDDNGLKCSGTHIGLSTMLGPEFDKTVDFHKTIGCTFLIVPSLPEKNRATTTAWRETAAQFNEVSARLKPLGMKTGYHNHSVEFTPIEPGGELPWDTFFKNTDKDVIMQFDTSNAAHAGKDALPFIERYPGRALTVHLKDYSKTKPKVLLGEGDIPFPKILDTLRKIGGTQWFVVEQESYPFSPMESVERSLRNLEKMLG